LLLAGRKASSPEVKPFPEKSGGVIYHCIVYVFVKLTVINQLDAVFSIT